MFVEPGRELLQAATLDEVLGSAAVKMRAALTALDVSLFLYSKEGALVRMRASSESLTAPEQYESYSESSIAALIQAASATRGAMLLGSAETYEWAGSATAAEVVNAFGTGWHFALLPLDGPNRTYGVVRVLRDKPFTDEERAWLSPLAAQVAVAISHMRREAEINIYAHVQRLLASPHVTIEQICDAVAQRMIEATNEFSACVIRIASRQDELQLTSVAAADGIAAADKDRLPRHHGVGVSSRVFEEGVPVIVDDVQGHAEEFADRSFVQKYGFATYACFPIGKPPRVLGTISLFVRYPYTFYPTKTRFIDELSSHLATAVKVVRLLEARAHLLGTQQKLVTSIDAVGDSLSFIVERAVTLTGASTGFLARMNRHDHHLRDHVPAENLPRACIPRLETDGVGHTAAAIAQKKPVRCADVTEHQACGVEYIDLTGEWAGKAKSDLVLPLMYGGHAVGTLNLVAERADHFTVEDELIAVSLAAQASALIQRAKFFDAASSIDRLALPRDDKDALHDLITRAGARLAGVDMAVLALMSSRDFPRVVAYQTSGKRHLMSELVMAELSPEAAAAAFDEHAVISGTAMDVETTSEEINESLAETEQVIIVPLSIPVATGGWEDIGVLILGANAFVPLFDEERQLLTTLGRAAAFALKEADLLEERDLAFDRAHKNVHLLSVAEIAAGLAHDLNNVTNVLWSAFATARHHINQIPEARENATIQSAMENTSQATETLRTYFAELKRYKQFRETAFQQEQLTSVVDEALKLMMHRLAKKRIRVRREFKGIPPVECDRERLVQVFVNLITNAVDAMKERGSLFVGAEVRDGRAEVRFVDNGVGIDEADKTQIFERWFTTKPEGTGIGLAICKKFVEELHSGSLDFESKRGKGSTFYVRLPIQRSAT